MKNLLDKVAVRINQTHTMAVRNILAYKQLKKLRLPHPALSHNIHMPSAISPLYTENKLLFFECRGIVRSTDERYLI
jgi:hypothetical protein